MNVIKKFLLFIILVLTVVSVMSQGLLQKAKSGNVRSMYELANQYYNGIGMLQSYKDAFIWYKQAADKNNVESQYKTAYMYENGLGVEKNLTNAFNYYQMAADRGHEKSQLKIAMMYDEGIGTMQSIYRAMIWYRLCAERNEVYSQRRLGDMYLQGNPVEENHQEAAYWYEKAVMQNDTPSMACLAYILSCNKSIKPDYTRAKALIDIALKNDEPMAQYAYAEMLYNGNGIAMDKELAKEYYKKSAKQGLSQSKEMLAIDNYYRTGDIGGFLDIDITKLNYSESWLILAKEYQSGEILKKNNKESLECYKKAAELGNQQAIEYLSTKEKNKIKKQ